MPDEFTLKMNAQQAMPTSKSIDMALDASRDDRKAVFELMTKMDEKPKTALSQEEVDRFQFLSSAYAGVNIPLDIQLAAYDNHGEMPSGIDLNQDILGGMDIVDWLRESVELQGRKLKFGVQKGVIDPEAILLEKQRAVVIYTKCALVLAEAEAIKEAAEEDLAELLKQDEVSVTRRHELETEIKKPLSRMCHFPAPDDAKLGRNGYIHLFPGFPDSPAGVYRGDGAAFSAQECIDFIGKHYPDVEDEFLNALADA